MGIMFFKGWNSIFFYVFYFIFCIVIGIQELSNSHFTVEYYDYLEWQTGERMEAIQGSDVGDLVKTMQAKPDYLNTCMWLLAFLLFGYALANVIKALVLKFIYNIEGETKVQMYKELEEMRKARHEENEEIKKAEAVTE